MIGDKLDGYTIQAELGSGGMGKVYLADTAETGLKVALKVIHPHLVAKEGFRNRFAREVEAGRRIRDQNVVATLGAGEVEVDGKPTLYIAMEFVEGQTLRDLLAELGRVPEDLCVHIGREVARALCGIHEANVFHRDIKPENVFITPDSRIKVMDLGVAVLADESMRLSQSGVFVGSVLYAAPEQFAEIPPDGRADLYNVGLLLYELATGRHPFQSDDMATVIQKQMTAHAAAAGRAQPAALAVLRGDRAQPRREGSRAPHSERRRPAATSSSKRSCRRGGAAARASCGRRPSGPLRRIRMPRETPIEGRDEELAQIGRSCTTACAPARARCCSSRARPGSARAGWSTSSPRSSRARASRSTSCTAATRPAVRRPRPARCRPRTASSSAARTSTSASRAA